MPVIYAYMTILTPNWSKNNMPFSDWLKDYAQDSCCPKTAKTKEANGNLSVELKTACVSILNIPKVRLLYVRFTQ